MRLYHGTNVDFHEIDLLKSKPNKDFGKGFYLSDDYSQAMNMEKVKVEQLETGIPVVMTYEVNEERMKELRVSNFMNTVKSGPNLFFRIVIMNPTYLPTIMILSLA